MGKFYVGLFFLFAIATADAQNQLVTDPPILPAIFEQEDTLVNMVPYKEETKPEMVEVVNEITPLFTDRPDQTECPFLVPTKMFQVETGYSVEYDRNKNTDTRNYTYNTTLLKYGVSKNWEFRLVAEYLGTKTISRNGGNAQYRSGMNSVSIGTKIFICEERGIIPTMALLAHLELPYMGSSHFKVKHLAPRFRFAMQHTISERISLGYNIGGEWDGDSQAATIIYTASLGISLLRNVNMFVEAYGFMTENSTVENEFNGSFSQDHRLDSGFTILLKRNLQLDLSGGMGISELSPDSFLSTGLSWRFPR
jgi:hypothetical protein